MEEVVCIDTNKKDLANVETIADTVSIENTIIHVFRVTSHGTDTSAESLVTVVVL